MAKATVLVVDRADARRREIVRELTALGYEVVAATTADEGRRYAAGVAPGLVVAEEGLAPAGGGPAFRIVLGDGSAAGDAGDVVIPAGLPPSVVVGRLRTAIIGYETGVAVEAGGAGLSADLRTVPVLEVIPRLHAAAASVRIALDGGEIALDRGEVARCSAGGTAGAKAFARLARTASGLMRIAIDPLNAEREIRFDVLTLMALAMEDGPRFDEAAARLPDLASRLRPVIGPEFFSTRFSPIQQRIMAVAAECDSVWDAVDRIAEPDGVALDEIARLAEMGFMAFDPPEVRVRIVTDSTSDLPAAIAERHDVVVVPASVTVDGTALRDGVDLTSGEFFGALTGADRVIGARAPTRTELLAAYRSVIARKDIVSVHPSARLSDAARHALEAAGEGDEDFRRVRGSGVPAIEVVDSGLVSTPLALLVTVAARLAAHRLSAVEIRGMLDRLRSRVRVFFAVEHPEYIARTIPSTGLSAFLGGLLGMRPILTVREGEIVAVERVRGEGNVPARLVALVREGAEPGRPVLAAIGHAAAPQTAVRLRSLLHEELAVTELLETEIGPAVGLHVGPGCVGVAALQPGDEELSLLGIS